MPAYSTNPPVLSCALGERVVVWMAENPTPSGATAASREVALTPLQGRHGFTVAGYFSGDPGMFQFDVQVANIDQDSAYSACTNGTRTSADPTNFGFFFHSDDQAPFVRLYMRTLTNSVNVTASVSRY